VRAKITAGEAMDARARDAMQGRITAALASARPGTARAELEGFAGMVADAMVELTSALSKLPALSAATRKEIADFDPTARDSGELAEAIKGAIGEAISDLAAGQLGGFIADARHEGSPVARYFDDVKARAAAPENRQLLLGIDRLVNEMRGGDA
jgi:hypothetical protein